MNHHFKFFSLLFTVLLLSSRPPVVSANTQLISNMDAIYQEKKNSDELFLGALSMLENISDFGTIDTYSENPGLLYYGRVGLAGIGLNLLETISIDPLWIDTGLNARLQATAVEIGDFLMSLDLESNSTHALIPINNQMNYIDLNYDYGLLGMADFFIELYNRTENAIYGNFAYQLLNSEYDLSHSNSTDMYIGSNINYAYNNSWYPYYDQLFYFDQPWYINQSITFYGMSLGVAGITHTALNYLRKVDTANTTLGNMMLNKSLHFLWKQEKTNGSEIYFNIGEQLNVQSTSYSTGMVGLGNLFLNLYDYTKNSTYSDTAIGIMHWLNGSTSLQQRTSISWVVDGSISDDIEFGTYFGFAGVIEYLDKIYDLYVELELNINDTLNVAGLLMNVASNLRFYGVYDEGILKFSERYIGGSFLEEDSTSLDFGSGGIYRVYNSIGQKYNNSDFRNFAGQIKNFLLGFYTDIGGINAIYYVKTFTIEMNPMLGVSGSLIYLAIPSQGLLDVDRNTISFPTTEIGTTSVYTLELSNIGEGDIEIKEISTSEEFTVPLSIFTITSGSLYKLNISFTPQKERFVESTLNMTQGNKKLVFDIEGSAYDNPTMGSFEGPNNNTMLTSFNKVDFAVIANDLSGISTVAMVVKNANGTQISSILMTPEGNKYSSSWTPAGYVNGTYYIDFVATDTLNHQTTVRYVYTIGVYTPQIEERIFSNDVLIGLLIVVGLLVIAAVILTRKIRS